MRPYGWEGGRTLYETASPLHCLCVFCSARWCPKHRLPTAGPKPAVTITVVNALAGEYYLDLPVTDPGDHANIDPADYDPNLPRAAD